ncbi:unnamed protein product [Microthlaspi erraticum]|uniref:Uncharacterized protein n=1 Tax=Microthlaspi erraticum TaxID=1685480 RepID=A0A6D2JIL2_9BRAS|nr:unnamed protein product [Microthlaspi erraticum]
MMSMARGRALNGLGWPFRLTNPRETPNTGRSRLYRQTFGVLRSKVERETAQIEKTSNWEGDPPGELTVPQTDTGEQVEYTRALERTMSKELGKMTPIGGRSSHRKTNPERPLFRLRVPNRRTENSGGGGTLRACLTVRPTGRTETKVGHSDPGVPCGRALAQRIKGTPGITG